MAVVLMNQPLAEPVEGQPCRVCGLPDPEHDWDVHEAAPPPPDGLRGAAGLPNMLARSSTRGRYTVRVLALHTTEGILRARDLRAWASWPGSSHAAADDTGALLTPVDGFVPYHLAAWTLRSGNPWSENIELCGFARWTRAEWLARPALLEAAARWLAARHLATGVPLVKITAQQYRAGASGVIDHDDHTDGYLDGTHWDVGEHYPWDVTIPRAQALAGARNDDGDEDDMPQVVSTYVEPGKKVTLPIPPVNAGAAGWGKAWASVVVDRHGAAGGPVGIRAGVMDSAGRYRPLFGRDMALFIQPGTRPATPLLDGDQALVLEAQDATAGVGVMVEYAAR